MGRATGQRDFKLRKSDLLVLLQRIYPQLTEELAEEIRLTRRELLHYCWQLKLISTEEYREDMPVAYASRKCHLKTWINDGLMLERLEHLVEDFSIFWYRAQVILNLLAHAEYDIPLDRPQEPELVAMEWSPKDVLERDGNTLYDRLFEHGHNPPFLRQVLIPERFIGNDSFDNQLRWNFWLHKKLLAHLRVPRWGKTLKRSGWDQICGDAGGTLRSACESHIQKNVIRCARQYVKLLGPQDKSDELEELLVKPWPKTLPEGIEQRTTDHVHLIRTTLGMGEESHLPGRARRLTQDLMDFFMHLAAIGVYHGPLLPHSGLGRRFAYVDGRVAQYLFPEHYHDFNNGCPKREREGTTFFKYLGLTPEKFYEATNKKRRVADNKRFKRQRKKAVKKKRRVAKKKDQRKKKKLRFRRRGLLKPPLNGTVRSIITDGISIVMRMSFSRDIPHLNLPRMEERMEMKPDIKKKRKQKQDEIDEKLENWRIHDSDMPTFVGIDSGRAKLVVAQFDDGADSKQMPFIYRRKTYYWNMGIPRKRREMEERRTDPILKIALMELAKKDFCRNMCEYLSIQQRFSMTLIEESIRSHFHAVWKMRTWKYRRRALDRMVNKLLKQGYRAGKRLIIGLGSAKFPATGKGELSAPTTTIEKALQRGIQRHTSALGLLPDAMSIIPIDEFRTTKVCSRCTKETSDFYAKKKFRKKKDPPIEGRYVFLDRIVSQG